ncbi:hypothetical protein NDU88_004628 [Pleurodeles waltl]|uniref:Reverse transcriptase domain-containing protein n=1 Tax=Pleurodeles waltl TaxID=8319 RepID=A0AAV7WAA4_PLEWA|nr:hypothetical protein NDU88_004628 [Pleurodeles waltl]
MGSLCMGSLSDAGRQWLSECGLVDVWRSAHPSLRDYSFYSSATETYARLDLFLATQELLPRVRDSAIEPRALSDHTPVSVEIHMDMERVGAPGWRFRDSMLHNGATLEAIRRAITDYLSFNDDGTISIATLWEALKAVLRGEVMSLSSRDNKARRRLRENLEQRVRVLERSHKHTGAPRIWRELEKLRKQLRRLDWDRAEYAVVHLKQKYYSGSNKFGRILAHRLRAQRAASMIKMVRSPSGAEAHTSDQIAEAFAEFYQGLYRAEEPSTSTPESFLEGIAITPLTVKEATLLVQPIREVTRPDGFSVLFYKSFCVELVHVLVRLFNSFRQTGALTPSMLDATIVVSRKPGKDPEECASYMPISLLNIDAKLFTGILAHRLNYYMPGLVDPDQAGFIPHRQCSDNTKRLLHLLDKTERSRREALFLSIDAKKAFDRVYWPYLFKVLERFGLGPGFMAWICCIYQAPWVAMRVNGTLSLPFAVQRGTRQGCPLSPLLFALYMEPWRRSSGRTLRSWV